MSEQALLPSGDIVVGSTWFHDDGSINSSFNPNIQPFYDLVQPDGRLVLVGISTVNGWLQGEFPAASLRFNTDGSPDVSWVPDAGVQGNLFGEDAEPSIALSSGGFLSISPTGVVVRLVSSGQRDDVYGAQQLMSTGEAPVNFIPNFSYFWQPIISAADPGTGCIWAAVSLPSGHFIFRFLADGDLDPSIAPVAVPLNIEGMRAEDGRLAYFGTTLDDGNFTAGRLNADGPSDPNYRTFSLPAYYVRAAAYDAVGALYLDFSEGAPLELIVPDSLPSAPNDVPWPGLAPYPALAAFNQTYREGIVRFDSQGRFDPAFSLNLDGTWPPTEATADVDIHWMGFAPSGQLYVAGLFSAVAGVPSPGVARLNLSAASQTAILANFSARGAAGPGAAALTGGLVIGNHGSKSVLWRGVGPTLSGYGVAGPLPDPKLNLYGANGQLVGSDVNWSLSPNAAAIAAAATAVGAFALPGGSGDAALLLTTNPGTSTFSVTGASGDGGTALLEVYDADTPPLTTTAAQFINLSARGIVSSGRPLVGGFVVTQGNTKRILIRAVGPTLSQFGIGNALSDPVLSLYQGQELIATEQGWGTWQSLLQPTFAAVGAFSLPANSADSALVLALPPGAYTAQVTSASGATGETMVELYAVP
ncbi:MAG TPA: hypothetical protein VGL42_00730 [Opitutaceae bacterium]